MGKGWFVVIVISVGILVIWTALEIYGVFRQEEQVSQYESLTTPISRELRTDVVNGVTERQEGVLVEKDEIEPK